MACNASQYAFIRETIGPIENIHLEGYNVKYSARGKSGLITQLPRLLNTIKSEHAWLNRLASERRIDAIISDNRYGLYHHTLPSVIMTHQLQVQSGLGTAADNLLRKIHYGYLARFQNVWVVDTGRHANLAGNLSHPKMLPRNTSYLGLLSRFHNKHHMLGGGSGNSENVNVVILLSGPEPQRSIFSRILWQQATSFNGAVTFIEGSDHAIPPPTIPRHIKYYTRLTDDKLYPILTQAGIIICRSGYSTLMDLVALQKKAIVVPTPGQTEQEYLGKYLREQQLFFLAKQQNFNLQATLLAAQKFSFQTPSFNDGFDQHKAVIGQWVAEL